MNSQDIEKIVNEDLRHIPEGKQMDCQNTLRNVFSNYRRHGINSGESKEYALARSLKGLKETHPHCNPTYDKDYFDFVQVEKLMASVT